MALAKCWLARDTSLVIRRIDLSLLPRGTTILLVSCLPRTTGAWNTAAFLGSLEPTRILKIISLLLHDVACVIRRPAACTLRRLAAVMQGFGSGEHKLTLHFPIAEVIYHLVGRGSVTAWSSRDGKDLSLLWRRRQHGECFIGCKSHSYIFLMVMCHTLLRYLSPLICLSGKLLVIRLSRIF